MPFSVVAGATKNGRIVVHDAVDGPTPVNLELDHVLGKMPQKVFELERVPSKLEPLRLPEDLTIKEGLDLLRRHL